MQRKDPLINHSHAFPTELYSRGVSPQNQGTFSEKALFCLCLLLNAHTHPLYAIEQSLCPMVSHFCTCTITCPLTHDLVCLLFFCMLSFSHTLPLILPHLHMLKRLCCTHPHMVCHTPSLCQSLYCLNETPGGHVTSGKAVLAQEHILS